MQTGENKKKWYSLCFSPSSTDFFNKKINRFIFYYLKNGLYITTFRIYLRNLLRHDGFCFFFVLYPLYTHAYGIEEHLPFRHR